MNVAFITNICPHYRVRTFEVLANHHDLTYYFFSAGDDWYWQQEHGIYSGNFKFEYLPGFRLGKTRVAPTLPTKLWKADHQVYIKGINGKFALPITFLIARLRKKPFILWTGIWMRLQTATHKLLFPFTKYIYKNADAIVVYGKHVQQYLISEGVQEDRIFIASHAMDNELYSRSVTKLERLNIRTKLGIDPDQRIVLYVGRLEREKGPQYLVQAIKLISDPDAILVIVGTGSRASFLKNLINKFQITERVRFAGYVPPNDLPPYYAIASVLVVPSITTPLFKEPWALVANEAFNQGVPVIATEAVGAAAGGLIIDGVNGFIVPEQDPEAISAKINLTLNNPSLLQNLRINSSESIAAWDNEQMVKGFLQAIDYVSKRN